MEKPEGPRAQHAPEGRGSNPSASVAKAPWHEPKLTKHGALEDTTGGGGIFGSFYGGHDGGHRGGHGGEHDGGHGGDHGGGYGGGHH